MARRLFGRVEPSKAEAPGEAGKIFQEFIETLGKLSFHRVITSTEGRIFILEPVPVEERRGPLEVLIKTLSQAPAVQFNVLEKAEAGGEVPQEKLQEILQAWCLNGCVIKIIGWPTLSKRHIAARLMRSYPTERLVDKWSRLFEGLDALASDMEELANYASLVRQHIIPTLIFEVGGTPVIVQPYAWSLREVRNHSLMTPGRFWKVFEEATTLVRAMFALGGFFLQDGLMLDPLGTEGVQLGLLFLLRKKLNIAKRLLRIDLESFYNTFSNVGVILRSEEPPRVVIFDPIAWYMPQGGVSDGHRGDPRGRLAAWAWAIQSWVWRQLNF